MNVTSGARLERIVRNGIFTLMCVAFGAWFLYDGWVGYPAKNFEENKLQLAVEDRSKADPTRVYPGANQNQAKEIEKALKEIAPTDRRDMLESKIGGPPTHESKTAIYYFGQDGLIRIEKIGYGLGSKQRPVPAKHSLSDFRFQKMLGYGLGAIGIFMLGFLIRVIRKRASVTDAGLSLNGGKPIAFESMRGLDDSNFRRKGRLDLIFADNGDDQRVTLDEYHFAKYALIIGAICEKTDFEDPVAREKVEKTQAESAKP